MDIEKHINGTYYKHYKCGGSSLLFFLPGQSLTPRAFWDFRLPNRRTHADYFLEAGIDIILFDPKGFGNSQEFASYDRIEYANQINYITDQLEDYTNKVIFGFSSSTAPALIAGEYGYFNKTIIHSPCIRIEPHFLTQYDLIFKSNIEILKKERLEKYSDKLIPRPNRICGWEKSIIDVVGHEWTAPGQVVFDINNYTTYHNNFGFKPSRNREILSIIGEYDYEITTGGYSLFKNLFPNYIEKVIPNSTHFSMWENNSHLTRKAIIDYVKV